MIVDVCYDHFLARHWQGFADDTLDAFVRKVYRQLNQSRNLLNEHQEFILTRMIDYDWLGSYYYIDHVGTALDRIAGRLARGQAFIGSVAEIKGNYRSLEADFKSFFPDLIEFAKKYKYPDG